jgi:predicted deacylase
MLPTLLTRDGIPFYVRGTDPKLLILSGTHGDEYEVTEFVTNFIEKHDAGLPDYLYIPEVSPSAVALKTRRNKFDRDLNRHFHNEPVDDEVKAVMAVVAPYHFSLCIAFHEDPDRTTTFYTYDSELMTEEQLMQYRDAMDISGMKLFTGIDDPADEHLSLQIEKGYISTPLDHMPVDSGFSMRWLVERGIADRVLNPEIPGKAKLPVKEKAVDGFFGFALQFV